MQTAILKLATDHFDYDIAEDEKGEWLRKLDEQMSAELQRYARYIAIGGPCTVARWGEISLEPELGVALVVRLVRMALKQHVFEVL